MSKSDCQRAAAAPGDSERKFQTLLYNLPEKVFHKDRQSIYVSCNRNYAADFGLEPEQMVGKTDYDLFPQEIADKYRADDERIMISGRTEEIEETYRAPTGEARLIRTVKTPLRDEDGRVTGILGIFSDITARKRAEQALQRAHVELEQRVAERTAELTAVNRQLEQEIETRAQHIANQQRAEEAVRQNEARYKALVESCPDAVAMCDLQGRIVFASQRTADQHGVAHPDELLGVPAKSLVAAQDQERFEANLQLLIQEGIRRDDQYLGIRRDGSTFEAEVSSAVIWDAEGHAEALMGVYRDISDRRRVEESLRAKDAELFVAAEIQSRLLPQESPGIPGFDIAGHCYPAEAAAGDHFDFLVWPDGSLRLVVGDVSGHNLGSAILAADFCARVRTLSEIRYGLVQMAENMNAALYRETAGETFVTAILAHLQAESRVLSYLNAGHPPIIVFDAAGRIKARLGSDGLPLAILPETPFYAHPGFPLDDGDLILFYTDGLVEAHRYGQPLFGLDRVIEVVQANRERSAAEIIAALQRAACQYAGVEKPQDDITVVIVKVLPRKAGSAALRGQRESDVTEASTADRIGPANSTNATLFEVEQSRGVTVIRPVEMRAFDVEDYAQFQRDLLHFVESQRPRKLLVDLSGIAYCSTAFINALLMAQRRVHADAGAMKLFGAGEVMLETLHHLKLAGTLFSLYPDETSARAGF